MSVIPVVNTNFNKRFDDTIELDEMIMTEAKERLKLSTGSQHLCTEFTNNCIVYRAFAGNWNIEYDCDVIFDVSYCPFCGIKLEKLQTACLVRL